MVACRVYRAPAAAVKPVGEMLRLRNENSTSFRTRFFSTVGLLSDPLTRLVPVCPHFAKKSSRASVCRFYPTYVSYLLYIHTLILAF